jgi:hypothetical protein
MGWIALAQACLNLSTSSPNPCLIKTDSRPLIHDRYLVSLAETIVDLVVM